MTISSNALSRLTIENRRMLLADWVDRLLKESGRVCSQHGTTGDGSFTLGAKGGFEAIGHPIDDPPYLGFTAKEPEDQATLDRIVPKAAEAVEQSNLGGYVWYLMGLEEPANESVNILGGAFMQHLGLQRRISGWRRIGPRMLLEFVEPDVQDTTTKLFAPKVSIRLYVGAPGPFPGHFASMVAAHVGEAASGICSFALGRCVDLFPGHFPAKPADIPQLEQRDSDAALLTLARNGVALDVFGWALPETEELFLRLRAAFMTFKAAMGQTQDAAACLLYVAAAECLTTPRTEWRREKLTKRFITFFDELMPEALDTLVEHGNFEEAFGIRRHGRTSRAVRREWLDQIYDYRSSLIHEGLPSSPTSLLLGLTNQGALRRALLAEFAEGAICAFLTAPRSSIIGNPLHERPSEVS